MQYYAFVRGGVGSGVGGGGVDGSTTRAVPNGRKETADKVTRHWAVLSMLVVLQAAAAASSTVYFVRFGWSRACFICSVYIGLVLYCSSMYGCRFEMKDAGFRSSPSPGLFTLDDSFDLRGASLALCAVLVHLLSLTISPRPPFSLSLLVLPLRDDGGGWAGAYSLVACLSQLTRHRSYYQ